MRSSHLSPNGVRAGFSTWRCPYAGTTGCRGVFGPVPRPLSMSPLISTDADRLIYSCYPVNREFVARVRSHLARAWIWRRLLGHTLGQSSHISPRVSCFGHGIPDCWQTKATREHDWATKRSACLGSSTTLTAFGILPAGCRINSSERLMKAVGSSQRMTCARRRKSFANGSSGLAASARWVRAERSPAWPGGHAGHNSGSSGVDG